ncbi:IS1182 family transposase [Paenibacillus sp. FSL H8-0548]|uniref:IS5/IS1182 family transposase n=1 Tax=Paenibacillus sp. FSL H8-0548 TaxID=1920422 RepID=UPI00096ECED2|nr:IS5/IS1182 family transposase [Paenibacillus sp. FSL H8-0548]OMF16149.1 IS1182 family transposase [Paenibacillus sp. FSL H8-0548]
MPYIRHESLFTLQELYEMEQKDRFLEIFSTIDITPILRLVRKTSLYGAPVEVNYRAMVYSLIVRIVERIPTIKDLIKRLQHDILFRLDCGFMLSEAIPSASSYSRLVRKMSQSYALEEMQDQLLKQAMAESFITDDTVAIDATHIEARDQAPAKQEKEKPKPKKRGRKSKAEREAWLEQKQEEEKQKPIFEKEIAAQLSETFHVLRDEMPLHPQWGIKKNSDGKNVFWYGYKGHLAVGTKSQYILGAMLSSGNLNDGKAAIPLLKGIALQHPNFHFNYAAMDAGYDYEPIYKQVREAKAHAVIAYNRRREPELVGFDEHFAPTCVREHSYRYDSYDSKYETLKYVRPKECESCPLTHDSLCQKVYKMKITIDLRKYSAPARGSKLWKEIAKKRSAVERVNAYLKEFFQLNNVRHRTGQKAKAHFNLVTLVYNCTKLACDRLSRQLQEVAA